MSKTIVITGASSGIGLHLAKELAKNHHVIGVSRTKPKDINFDYIACDLTHKDELNHLIETLSNQSIDVLVHCAGVGTGGSLEDIPVEYRDWVFDVNLFSVMTLTNGLLPSLRKSSLSKIIMVGSVAGEITIPYQVSYSMSKSALHRYAEGLRFELKNQVDVSVVMPGDTKTGFTNNRKIIIPENSTYKKEVERSIAKMAKDEQNGVSPLKVVHVISKLIHKKRMPRSVIVGIDYKVLVLISKILPKRLVDWVVLKLYG